MNIERMQRMRERIDHALSPASLDIQDDSARHAGHAGAQSGAGHFIVRVVSNAFEGRRPLERHRLVYDAVADMMPREIHALTIDARTPGEAGSGPSTSNIK